MFQHCVVHTDKACTYKPDEMADSTLFSLPVQSASNSTLHTWNWSVMFNGSAVQRKHSLTMSLREISEVQFEAADNVLPGIHEEMEQW